jgi:hypothetical protein
MYAAHDNAALPQAIAQARAKPLSLRLVTVISLSGHPGSNTAGLVLWEGQDIEAHGRSPEQDKPCSQLLNGMQW